MDPQLVARALAGGRVALGAALFAAPGPSGRRWIGGAADRPETRAVLRGLGARDVAMGLGALVALDADLPVRRWLEAGVIADLGDAAAMLLAGRDLPLPTRLLTAAVGSAAAGLGVWLRGELQE